MTFPVAVVILAVVAAPLCLAESVDKSNLGTPEENEVLKLKGRTDPKRCCTPEIATVKFKQVVAVDQNGTKQVFEQDITVYQDVPNQRMAISLTGNVNKSTYTIRYVYNYNEGVLHTIYPWVRACVKSPGPKNASNCIPDDAEYIGSWRVGGKSASVMVDSWTFTMVDYINQMNATVQQTVTQEDCSPVTLIVYGGKDSMAYMANQMWSEIEEGVKDKSVFDLPDYCDKH